MIHRFQPIQPQAPEKPRWRLRLSVAFAVGGVTAMLCWWGGVEAPIAYFCLAACFIVSVSQQCDIEQKFVPVTRAGNWLQAMCNEWRIIRRGILFYRDNKEGPCLFLPWKSIQEVSISEGIISLWNAETNTFYPLPADEDKQQRLLSFIRLQIEQHKESGKSDASFEKCVHCTGSPIHIPAMPFVIPALPFFCFGLLCPFIFPGAYIACLFFFLFGASCAAMGHSELEENFSMASYMGEELRRTRRGIIIRDEEGITSFIPWSAFEEGIITAADSVFLRQRGNQAGIALAQESGYMPIPIARRYTKRHRWLRRIGRFALILVAAALGLIWCTLWS